MPLPYPNPNPKPNSLPKMDGLDCIIESLQISNPDSPATEQGSTVGDSIVDKMITRSLALRTLRLASKTTSSRTINTLSRPRLRKPAFTRSASHAPPQLIRWLSSKSSADEKIEEITELFYTAQDEFEIAMEETEKMTVYAEEDRKAAREELTRVQEAFKNVIEGPDEQLAEEVNKRIGQRVRELEHGVAAMEEMAMNQD